MNQTPNLNAVHDQHQRYAEKLFLESPEFFPTELSSTILSGVVALGVAPFAARITSRHSYWMKTLFQVLMSAHALAFAAMTHAQIPVGAQLSLNSNGKLLAIGGVTEKQEEVIDIIDLTEKINIKKTRLNLNNYAPFTISFGRNPSALIFTTRIKDNRSALIAVDISNINAPQITKLYSSPGLLRFPKQIDDSRYLFLEEIKNTTGSSLWKLFDGANVYKTTDHTFRLASYPSVIGGNVFLPIPIKGFGIVDILGNVPIPIRNFFGSSDGFMVCADKPLTNTCIKDGVSVFQTFSYGELAILIGADVCKVHGKWQDLRSMTISSNGAVAAFQAIPFGEKERGIYLIDINDKSCNAQKLIF